MKVLITAALIAGTALAQMQSPSMTAFKPTALRGVGIDQKMGAQVPLDVPFADEFGHTVTLRQYLGKPVILALVYYTCPSLCDMVLDGAVRSIKGLKMTAGSDYNLVAVSFDSRDTPEIARDKKAMYLKQYGRSGAENGFHFLTGPGPSSRGLADAVGFHYAFDSMTNQFAHASTIMILTPEGRVARYFYGIDYPARDVKFGLEDATGGKISSPIDAVLLYCYHYDPSNGKYGFAIMKALRIGGGLTLAFLLGFMLLMFRRDFRHAPPDQAHTHAGTT